MSDYSYWQAALEGDFGPLSEGEAFPGFWRRRIKSGGGFLPVAIWPDETGTLAAICDGKQVDPADVFSYCARRPVTEEAYRQRVETGTWPDEDPAVKESLAHDPKNETADEAEVLKDQIDSALAGVEKYAKIEDETQEAAAQGLRSRLLELHRDADGKREKIVRPFLDGEKAANAIWMPLVREAKVGADAIKTALGAFATAQKRKRDAEEAERQRLARVAAQEAEKARQEAEAAGRPAPEPVPEPPPPPTPAPAQTQIRPSYGRAATKKTVKKAIIQDYSKAVVALSSHPEMKELVEKLAQRAVTAGVMVAGVEFDEVVDVR
jgi:hypothetical protein